MKSSALATKPQVLKNCPVLGLRTALFSEWLNFVDRQKNIFLYRFFRDCKKKFLKVFFFRTFAFVSLVLGLGLESVCPRKGCPWPHFFCVLGLGLEPCLLYPSTDSGCYFASSISSLCKILKLGSMSSTG